MASESVLRISKEIANIQKQADLSIAVAFRDEDVRRIRALIVGPPDTPYEFGFFEFSVIVGKDYPYSCPSVKLLTTNSGRTRFNPNLYSDGKVCLSILGTWRGEEGEQWSTAQSLESVLWSIQSLMSPNPYENEPGYEHRSSDRDKKDAKDYALKIRHESLRVSVVRRLENYYNILSHMSKDGDGVDGVDPSENLAYDDVYEPFADLCKRRFLWYYTSYKQRINEQIEAEGQAVSDGTNFRLLPFEAAENGMDGSYEYTRLKTRIDDLKKAVDKETAHWAEEGKQAVQKELPVALSFQNKFKNIVQEFKRSDAPVDLELIDENPFTWRLTFFGQPMTNLDGGIFKVKISFSTLFPAEQPRVVLETPLFHDRVSPDGVLCYLAPKEEEIKSHIESIIETIQDESPTYDPRILVNPEASKLLWGSADQKKMYNRKLRRSAQESSEYC